MNIRTALPFVFGLVVVACGGETTPPANSPTSTTNAAHDSSKPGEKSSEHKGEHKADHGTLAPPVKAFHDELSPLWHADKGPDRTAKTCAAVGSLKDKAAATSDKDLIEATSALAAECAKTGDKADFESKFSTVHDKFHALAKQSEKSKLSFVQQYLDLLKLIIEQGKDRADRTGTGTRGIFGHQMRFDLREGFPLLTTKKLHTKSIIHELLWFLRGETHVKPLQDAGVRIWNEWATAEQTARFGRGEGDLGPVYGHQWRNFGATLRKDDGTYEKDGVDQIKRLLHDIKEKPHSRRLIVTGWNPKEAEQVALPPCHTLFQFYVQDEELSCQLYQRSADVFLGVPFNIASYALLTHAVAHATNLKPGDFVHSFGDAHLYKNHLEQAQLQLTRTPRPLPKLRITTDNRDLFTFKAEDFVIEGYDPHPHIAAEVSV